MEQSTVNSHCCVNPAFIPSNPENSSIHRIQGREEEGKGGEEKGEWRGGKGGGEGKERGKEGGPLD